MKGLRLAVIAGTSEATDLIAALPEQDSVTAFAATEYGKTILEGQHARCVWDGWMRMAFALHCVGWMR